MQNKANLLDAQMNVTSFITKYYENKWQRKVRKNKPNSNPNKANLRKAKMNVNSLITKDYRKKDDFAVRKNKPNSKPISEKPKMNINLYVTKDYENVPLRGRGENKPNQTQSQNPTTTPTAYANISNKGFKLAILADGVSPVLATVFGRIPLIEQMPTALPETESVRIVEGAFRANEMIDRPVRIIGHLFPRLDKPQHERIRFQLCFLLAESIGEGVFRDTRGVVAFFSPGPGLPFSPERFASWKRQSRGHHACLF